MINVLEKHKTVRLGGVAITIRQLSPVLFMDSDKTLPINNVMEAVASGKDGVKSIEDNQDEIKATMETVILKGVVKIKRFFRTDKIENIIETIMDNPEVYSNLFIAILNHSLGVKKKHLNQFI